MVDEREEPKLKAAPKLGRRKRRAPSPEETWIREFVAYTGTENITRFCASDLHDVSLTRAIESLLCGEMMQSVKCDGPGTICTYEHYSDEGDGVEVTVWFVAAEAVLEIRSARCIKEDNDSEPDAA